MLFGFCSIFVTLLPISSAYSQNFLSPQKAIQDASDKLHQRLEDQSFKKDFAKITQFVNEVIYPHTAFDKISPLVLGEIWKTATPDERERFKNEFQTLFIRTYSRAFAEFKDWSVRVLPIDMEPGANKVIVKTEILQPGIQPVGIDYRMFLSGSGQWKIYDFMIEDVSLVTNYRTTFSNEVQQKGSLSTVIDELAKRNAEALSSRSPVVSSDNTVSGVRSTAAKQVTTSNCPTTLTLNLNERSEQLEVRALKEKLFTKAELDEYYESLLSDLEKSKAWVAQYNSGRSGDEYLTHGEYEPKHALYGCPAGSFDSDITHCYRLEYNPISDSRHGVIDYITPRIELYRCHKEAGWPSATDSQVAGNSEGSKKKKQCDVSAINNEQSVNGFNFKIVESPYGSKMIEGYGGPCRNVGVEKIVTQLESVKTFQKRSFGQNAFFSLMGNMPSSGNEFTYPIGPNQDYASSTNHFLQQWRNAESAGSPDARGIKETYMMNECIEMNHQKYQVALEDWVGANLKELKNCASSD